MRQIRSKLATPTGLAALLVLALLSAYRGIGLLFAMLTGAFLVCLCSWLWTRYSLRNVKFEVKDAQLCAFPGDRISARVCVENNKFLPVVWLKAQLPVEDDRCVSSREEGAAVFSWVMPHQSISWTEDFTAVKRGVYCAEAADVASGDGFGLSELSGSLKLKEPFRAVVFPRIFEIDTSGLLRKLSELESSKRGYYKDPTLVRSIKDYGPADSVRDINWRLMARSGELLVNVKEKLDVLRTCLVIDLESFSYVEEVHTQIETVKVTKVRRDELEHLISLAASAAAELSRKGVVCSLAIPGYYVDGAANGEKVRREQRVVMAEDLASQPEIMLTALAEIDYAGGQTDFPLEDISANYHKLGQLFCFASVRGKRTDALDLAQPGAVWYVLTDGPEGERVIMETELLK